MAMAQLQKLLADTEKAAADAAKSKAAAEEIANKIAGINVETQQKALDAAGQAIAVPAATKVADYILSESGFKPQTDKEQAAFAQAREMQQAAAQKAQQQAAQADAMQQQKASQQQPGIGGGAQAPQQGPQIGLGQQ
jgi:hypothetical protein